MSTIRFEAIKQTFERIPVHVETPEHRSDLFGANVFNAVVMRQVMSKEAYNSVMDAIEGGGKINRKLADEIATYMKIWAISKGATHHTHRSEEHTSELQSRENLVCRLLL